MRSLIEQVRDALPFDEPRSQMCAGPCHGCSVKLLAFLEAEMEDWERRLGDGERPCFGDLSRLARISKKIHKELQKNGLVKPG